MLERWWRLIYGQVRVQVVGASLARFLNACAAHEIELRGLAHTGWNELYATLSVRDFRRLLRYMGRTGCRVHIVKRRGLPFVIARFRARYVLWGGVFVVLWLLWVMYAHIWAIEMQIDPMFSAAALQADLQTLGIGIGTPTNQIDERKAALVMLQRYPEMSFFSLNPRGNVLRVVARGDAQPAPILDESLQTRVVAKKDGVVKSIYAAQGQASVQVGSAVRVGDELISSIVPPTREDGGYRQTHARGEVQAYTKYQLRSAMPLTEGKKHYTGRQKTTYALVFGNFRVNLYFGSGNLGGTCDKIIEHKKLWLSDSVVFPISLVVQRYTYFEQQVQTKTAEQVKTELLSDALAGISGQMDGIVTGHQHSIEEREGAAVLSLSAAALEQIGEQVVDDTPLPTEPPPLP